MSRTCFLNRCSVSLFFTAFFLALALLLLALPSGAYAQQTLILTTTGTGTGTVTSSPAGIDCGVTCSTDFADSTVVTLTAVSDAGSTFTGWTGEGCSGIDECVVTMDAAKNVTATFNLPTSVSGSIVTDTTWTLANSPYYITAATEVVDGVTLSIEAGVIIKFAQGTYLRTYGTITAAGLLGSKIYFTDYRDDSVGGDTNGDGAATSPAAGWWASVMAYSTGTIDLDHCEIRYAGFGNNAAVYKDGSVGSLSVTNSSISNFTYYGMYIFNGSASYTISNNTITGGSYGIHASIATGTGTISGNTIQNAAYDGIYFSSTGTGATLSNNTVINNGGYGIYVLGTSIPVLSDAQSDLTGNTKGYMGFDPMASDIASNYDSLFPGQTIYVEGGGITGADITWDSDRTYLIKSSTITVYSGATLDISPGAVIKFAQGLDLRVYGALTANGLPGSRIYFTDYRDDSVGGDTNGSDGGGDPGAGWWGRILTYAGGTTSLDYCDIRYGGYINTSVIQINGTGNLTVTNSLISYSAYDNIFLNSVTVPYMISGNTISGGRYGIYLVSSTGAGTISGNTIQNTANHGISLNNTGSGPTLSSNTITSCGGFGIYLSGTSTPVLGDTQTDLAGNAKGYMGFDLMASENASNYNTLFPDKAIFVDTGYLNSGTVTWDSIRTYVVAGSYLDISTGTTLDIRPGVVVKLVQGAEIRTSGTLKAEGLPGREIYFTDYRDDTVGGDTNGDGAATSPAAGWWGSLVAYASGTISLDYCDIRYGGSSTYTVRKDGSEGSMTVKNSSFSNNANANIYLYYGSAPATISDNTITGGDYGIFMANVSGTKVITGNTITGCDSGIDVYGDPDLVVVIGGSPGNGNDIYNNTSYGVRYTYPAATINAEYNYWGSTSGPYNASTNSSGTGNQVSDYIDYEPYFQTTVFSGSPDISVDPASISFGSAGVGASSSQAVTISNSGPANLDVYPVTIAGADAGQFSIQNDFCSGQTLVPFGSCTLSAVFEPVAAGSKTGALIIRSNDSSVKTVSMSGTSSYVDTDGDTYTNDVDCDDDNPSINPGAADDNCDGVDDNCSGSADEGYTPTGTTCDPGACSPTGQLICVGGVQKDTCINTPAADDTVCDGIDNDCDGQTDEDYVPVLTNCGIGACSAAGQLTCTAGVEVDTCTPGTPAIEGPFWDPTCSDGTDNDCDWDIDGLDLGCFEAPDSGSIPGAKHVWTEQTGTFFDETASGVATDTNGNVLVAGHTYGGIDTHSNAGGADLFVVKYDSTGQVLGSMQMGSDLDDVATGVAADSSNNVYVTGYTYGDLDGNTNEDPSGLTADIFLVKYNSLGVKVWSRQMGTGADDKVFGIALDGNGGIYISGHTEGSLDGYANAGGSDLALAKYNSAGVLQWAAQLGSVGDDSASSVAADGSIIYMSGYTSGSLDGNAYSGDRDIFLARYDSSGAKQWTRQLGTAAEDSANAVSLDGSGNAYVAGYSLGGLDGNTHVGSSDIVLVKYDSSGSRLWTKQTGTTSDDRSRGIVTELNGSVYVTGYTSSSLDGVVYEGAEDVFVMEYNSSGVKQWVRQLGTFAADIANGAAVDGIGNVYIAGVTSGGLDGNANEGSSDIFLVKYDGFYEWSRQLGTTSYDYANGMAVDGSGNVLVTGSTYGYLDGNINAGGYDAIVAQYSNDGEKQWTRLIGTEVSDYAGDIAADASGNVYVAGYTYGDLDGNTNADPSGLTTDIFLARYNSAGMKQWTRQIGTIVNDEAYGVAVDENGDIYVAGYTEGDLDGNTNAGGMDLFLVKYDASGLKLWTKQMGTTEDDIANNVMSDGAGGVYVTGETGGGLDGNSSAGSRDLFLARYDAAGVKQWTRQLGTFSYDYAYDAAADAGGNVYVTGRTFDGLDGNTSAQSYDVFLVKYDSAGVKQWTKQMGSVSSDSGQGVAVDGYSNVYVTGYSYGDLDGNRNEGGDDIVLVMYDADGNRQWTRQIGTDTNDRAYGIEVDSSGSVYLSGGTHASFDGNLYAGDYDAVIIKYSISGDSTAPTGSVIIESGAALSNSASVNLDLACSDAGGCREMKFSNNSTAWSDSKAYASSWTWDMTDAAYGGTSVDGVKSVYAMFMDSAGNWSLSYSDSITLDTTLPTGSLTINGGSSYTSSILVLLTISGSDLNGIDSMMFSNDGINNSSPESFKADHAWSLSSGDGEKTVYGVVKDNAGNWSAPFSDTIILDTTAPVTTPDNPGVHSETFVNVSLGCDDGSGIGCASTYYCLGAGCNPDTLYSTGFTFSEGTTLRYYSEDALGNTETVKEDVYTFVQAATELSLSLSAPRILSGGTVDVVGQLLRNPENGESRNGLTIRFEITGPSPVPPATQTTTYTDSGLYSHTISGFVAEGIYTIKAVFDGTGLLSATPQNEIPEANLYVGPSAGYAIIVQGKITGGSGLPSHNKTTNRIYTKLKDRGFNDSDIYYFNYDTAQNGVDELPTKAGVQAAVEFWAKFKMNELAAPLYVIMTNHGDETDGIYLESESITPTDLNVWLSTLEGGLDAEALQKKRFVIVGACYSGAFIPVVSKTGRVVISSSAADEVSYKGPFEKELGLELRSGEFFMEELFTSLERGKTIKEAFEEATVKTETYTRRDSVSAEVPPYYDNALQHPMMDDNGDGVGSNYLTSTGDGNEVVDLYLGVGEYYVPNQVTNPAEITAVTETVHLAHGTEAETYTMWADVNDDSKVDGAEIWFEVRKPSEILASASGSDQAVAAYLLNFLESRGSGHWDKLYDSFDEYGKYEVFYSVRDVSTQKVSPVMRSVVYRDRNGNVAAGAFNITAPAYDSIHVNNVLLGWEEAVDTDNGADQYCDGVTYTVEISTDSAFASIDYKKEEIETTSTVIGPEAGLSAVPADYYWRVWAIDSCGAKTLGGLGACSAPACRLNYSINPANPNPKGVLQGYIRDAVTKNIIQAAGATVTTSDSETANTGTNGAYVMLHESGNYTLNVTGVSGYQDRTGVPFTMRLASGGGYVLTTVLDIELTPACTPVTEVCDGADNDCDAQIDEGFPDTDSDGVADCVDSDIDGDGIPNGSDTCQYTMPAKIGAVEYPTVWDAYTNANTDDTIRCHDIIYDGDFTADRNITVTIEGGYNCDYSSVTGTTTIEGDMMINDGKVTVKDVDIQPSP